MKRRRLFAWNVQRPLPPCRGCGVPTANLATEVCMKCRANHPELVSVD